MALHDPSPTRARDAYAPTVQNLCPGCDGEELQLRCSLLLMRDHASAHSRRCSEEAAAQNGLIEGLVTRKAFAAMPINALRELRAQVAAMRRVAIGLDLHAWELGEGADGRG